MKNSFMLLIKISTLFIVFSLLTLSHAKPVRNGFDLSATTIPSDKIFIGGPPRDGIPSIDKPEFLEKMMIVF